MRQFTFLFIGIGLVFLFLIPAFQKPDEIVQYHKTIALASGSFRCGLINNQPVHSMPAYLAYLPQTLFSESLAHNPQVKIAKTEYLKLVKQTAFDRSIVFEPTSCPLNPFFYMIPAIVLFFPVQFGFHPLVIFYIGRVVMFALCGVVCVQAVRLLSPSQRKLLYLLLFLPMTLQQLTSYSKDALHLAFGVLFFALFLKLRDIHQKHFLPKYALFCLSGLILVLTRVQYFAFLFLLLEPLVYVKVSRKALKKISHKKLFAFIGVFLVLIGVFIFSLQTYSTNFFTLSFDSYVKNVYPMYQLQNISMDPMLFIQRLLDTINSHFDFYLKSGVGMLGWLDTIFPHWVYLFYLGGFFYVVVTLPKEDTLRKREAVLIGFVTLITVFTIFLSFYLFWTPVGAGIVEGVQGRYFLVLLPFVALISSSVRWRLGDKKLIVLVTIGCLVTGYTLFNRYYDSSRYYYVESTMTEIKDVVVLSQIHHYLLHIQPEKKLVGVLFKIGGYQDIEIEPSIIEIKDEQCDQTLFKKVIDIGQVQYEKDYQILLDRTSISGKSTICIDFYPMGDLGSSHGVPLLMNKAHQPLTYPIYLY